MLGPSIIDLTVSDFQCHIRKTESFNTYDVFAGTMASPVGKPKPCDQSADHTLRTDGFVINPEEHRGMVLITFPQIILIISPNRETLQQLVEQIKSKKITKENVLNISSSAICREQFVNRAIAVCEQSGDHVSVKMPEDTRKYEKIVILFAGQGVGYSGMCEKLTCLMPQISQHFETCINTLKQYPDVGLDIPRILYSQVDHQTEVKYAQICIFVIQYGLFKTLLDIGCKADCVIGHSIGDITAACVSGCISLEDTLDFLVARWRAFETEKNQGRSAAINLDGRTTEELIKFTRLDISIACYNSPQQTVVSGCTESISNFIQIAKSKNIKTKLLPTNNAFHSTKLDPIAKLLKSSEAKIHHCVPDIKMISTVTGAPVSNSGLPNGYFTNHVLNPVKFTSALSQVYDESTIFC